MSFNRTQSRAVIVLLTGHTTLRQHLYPLGLQDSQLCRKCGVMEETSAHILCECEALTSLRHAHLGFFFLEPKDIQSISLGAIWSFSNASGLPWLDMGHKGPVYKGLGASGPRGPKPLTYSHILILTPTNYEYSRWNTAIRTEIHTTLGPFTRSRELPATGLQRQRICLVSSEGFYTGDCLP
jgi:hypothetical protein